MRLINKNLILLILFCLCSCSVQDTGNSNSNGNVAVIDVGENNIEDNIAIKQKDTLENSIKYCDVSKFDKFAWNEVLNTIDTNDVEYDSLDPANKVLYKLYDSRFIGTLIKDESFHKFFILHSEDANDWADIVKLDMLREKLHNEYYLYVVYEKNDYKDIVRYDLIDGMSKMLGIDIVESDYIQYDDYYDELFVFTHEYLKDIEICPELKSLARRGADGDIRTIIYPHLFTEYNFKESLFSALFLNVSINDLFTEMDSLKWENWALSKNFLSKYNEEQGLIEQIVFEGKPIDFVNEISAEVDLMDYGNSLIYFTVYSYDSWHKKYKAKLFINKDYFLDDIVIEEIK